jgi:hypothetical protein
LDIGFSSSGAQTAKIISLSTTATIDNAEAPGIAKALTLWEQDAIVRH